mgnify:CR=1 FL=1
MCNFSKMIPLILRLRKVNHREVAKAQDMIVQTLYEVFDDAVFHGGTCIWRCYKGNRFSEDIDVYLRRDLVKINKFFEILEKKGLRIERKKIGENSVYSNLFFNRTAVRFEAIFKKTYGSLREYETAEGNFITVYALIPEELIVEKVATYLKRLKIRDLYDIFFLLRFVNNIDKVRKQLDELIIKFKQPIDEKELRTIILEGIVPDKDKMVSYIKSRL